MMPQYNGLSERNFCIFSINKHFYVIKISKLWRKILRLYCQEFQSCSPEIDSCNLNLHYPIIQKFSMLYPYYFLFRFGKSKYSGLILF
jgi:hypothetical protein